MHIILIFIDGLGLGANDPAVNPIAATPMPFLKKLLGKNLTRETGKVIKDNICLVPTDATLQVSGLPQSATGQTAIFTGLNAPAIMQRHIHAFPGPALTKLIAEYGIMGQLVRKGYHVTSANMYTPDYMELVTQRKRRHSATTLTILHAGQELRSVSEMQNGLAVYQDITNAMLPELGINHLPIITPAEAGKRLVNIAKNNHFTLFEYFQTDRQGHKRDWEKAATIIQVLDEFFYSVYCNLEQNMTVIITSDHGNFEDFSVKTHTLNEVPTIIFGDKCRDIADKITRITDITPAILAAIERNEYND